MSAAHVQEWAPTTGGGDTVAATGTATTDGNAILVRVTHRTAGVGAALDDFTLLNPGGTNMGSVTVFLFLRLNAPPTSSLTVEFTASVNSTCVVHEISGVSSVRGTAVADTRSSNTTFSPIVAAATAGDLVFGMVGSGVSNRTWTLQGSTFTGGTPVLSGQMTNLGAWAVAPSTASYGPQWNITSGSSSSLAGVTVVLAAAGGDPDPVEQAVTAAADVAVALSVSRRKDRAAGPASVVDVAEDLARAVRRAAGAAGTVDEAVPLGRVRVLPTAAAGSIDVSAVLVRRKARPVTPAVDVAWALPFPDPPPPADALTAAVDVSSALVLARRKVRPVAPAVDVAGGSVLGRAVRRAVAAAVDVAAAAGLARGKARQVATAADVAAAVPLDTAGAPVVDVDWGVGGPFTRWRAGPPGVALRAAEPRTSWRAGPPTTRKA